MIKNKSKTSIGDWISEGISFVFHPLFVPLYGVWLYFHISPRYFLQQNINLLIKYLLSVSIAIPILFLLALRFKKVIQSVQLHATQERFVFSAFMSIVYLIIFIRLVTLHDYIELFPFFFGIFLSLLMLSVLNFQKIKPSIHSMAMSGLLTFFLIWSYYSKTNILFFIALLIMGTSLVVAVRLHLEAHTGREIMMGLLIGASMQIIAFFYILNFF